MDEPELPFDALSGAAFRDEDVLNPVTDEITALAPRLMAFGEDRVVDDPLVIHGASIQPERTRRQRDGGASENFLVRGDPPRRRRWRGSGRRSEGWLSWS